ncbi:uncharacterized protein LOC135437285 [Drosophila montana]|uniref:uncharacterized protein LOC135437285 n=1 Tax=Drosophila montana TaxID=40370 RepID=UPI00313B41D8
MPAPQKQSFFSRNIVAVVMIPTLIAVHLGWKILQENRKLVTVEEQIDLPPITFAKYALRRLTGDDPEKGNSSDSPTK